jgi:hypothetical protein
VSYIGNQKDSSFCIQPLLSVSKLHFGVCKNLTKHGIKGAMKKIMAGCRKKPRYPEESPSFPQITSSLFT